MDREQEKALRLIEEGHNIVLLGQAGSGKTYTIRQCVQMMKEKGKTFKITCYTGVACLQYTNIQATTLHKFAGLEDGRHHKKDLLQLINSDERFHAVKMNFIETDCLIIDEASMVSAKILDNIEYLSRHIRKVDNYFGGMQIVLVGDVFQLPPIIDELNGDYGKHFFELTYFTKVFPHAILLKSIHRQQEEDLINAVNQLERGCPSEETNSYLSSLNRPLTGNIHTQTVKLFARNLDADVHNASMLQNIQNPVEIFTAKDHGDAYYLKKILAPKILALKKDCKVMLLKNLSDKLVNGLIGKVIEISRKTSQIIVEFCIDGKNIHTCIDLCSFTKVDPESNLTLCQRQQFPLRLAYGITIHKSQGMTIQYLEVDCKYAHHPGQLGVAIGRAVCSDGLRVVNYHPSLCQKHPQKVYKFHEKCSEESVFLDDLSCCHPSSVSDESLYQSIIAFDELETILQESDEEEMELSETFLEFVDNFSGARPDVISTFREAMDDYIGTPLQKEIHMETDKLLKEKTVNDWFDDQKGKVLSILESARPKDGKNFENKHFTDFYTKFDTYINSEEYLSSALVRKAHPTNRNVTTSVLFTIQKHVLKEESQKSDKQEVELDILPKESVEISSGGLGKIRYIGGYTVAKCKYRISKTMRNNLYLPSMTEEVIKFQDQICILDNMSVHGQVLSDYQDTLEEAERKQNIRGGLTHITDVTFKFFEFVEIKTRQLLKYSALYEYRRDLYHHVVETLSSDIDIFELFVKLHDTCPLQSEEKGPDIIEDICTGLVLRVQNLEIVIKLLLSLYVKVSISQFRKDLVQAIKLEKTKALRKRIGEKKKKQEVKFIWITS